MAYLQIHLLGAGAAIALHFVLMIFSRSVMKPMRVHIDALNKELKNFDLFFNAHEGILVSSERGLICPIYTDFRILPLMEWGVVVQSLFLSWLNFILVGLGCIRALSMKSTMGNLLAHLESETSALSDHNKLKSHLFQISTSALDKFGGVREKAQIYTFIEDHI